MHTISRRQFLKTSASMAAATAAFNSLPPFLADTEKPIGIQLYSLRDDIKDGYLEDVLKGLARTGYAFVEGYGYDKGKIFDKTPKEFRTMLKEFELKLTSSHCTFETSKHWDEKTKDVNDAFKKLVEDSKAMGQRYLVSPWMAEADRKDGETLKGMCDRLNKAGAYCKTMDLTFGYHNHEFEFKTKFDGVPMYDMMMENLNPENITMELDLCWVVYGERNAVDLFEKYPGRFQLGHFKDLAEEGKRETAIIGEGVVDFEAILKKTSKGGMRHFIVELENYQKSPLDDVKMCYKNLRKLMEKVEKDKKKK